MASSLSSNSFALLLIACKQATVMPRYEMRHKISVDKLDEVEVLLTLFLRTFDHCFLVIETLLNTYMYVPD